MTLYSLKMKKQIMDLRNRVIRDFFDKFWVLIVLCWLIPSQAWAFDFKEWDGLLKKHVGPTTLAGVRLAGVDYPAMKKDPGYAKLIADLKTFFPATLKSREEKLAFWINAYNIMAVKMVLDHYPVDSIKDAGSLFGSVWNKEVGVIGGKEVTLNQIEHEILRKMGDPRIHVAIVCASVSCPDLRSEAYTADRLDAQLDDQLKLFLENRDKGLRVDRDKKQVVLSKIFDWFQEDFETRGGVLSFVSEHAPMKDRSFLKQADVDISYLDYNWDLNKRN